MRLLENDATWGQNADGLYVKRTQVIPQEFLDDLKSERAARSNQKHQELNLVASVPTHIVELWLRQGIDVWHMTAREVVQKLERDNLQVFVVTPGRV